MRNKYTMTFGKYKGVELGDIPANYLLWLSDQDFCPTPVRDYVTKERKHLEKENQEEKARWKEVEESGATEWDLY